MLYILEMTENPSVGFTIELKLVQIFSRRNSLHNHVYMKIRAEFNIRTYSTYVCVSIRLNKILNLMNKFKE